MHVLANYWVCKVLVFISPTHPSLANLLLSLMKRPTSPTFPKSTKTSLMSSAKLRPTSSLRTDRTTLKSIWRKVLHLRLVPCTLSLSPNSKPSENSLMSMSEPDSFGPPLPHMEPQCSLFRKKTDPSISVLTSKVLTGSPRRTDIRFRSSPTYCPLQAKPEFIPP